MKIIPNKIYDVYNRLTPKECWRAMGFTDEDFEKAQKVNSDTQLYKQAGNSIVVDVLEAIFRQIIPTESEDEYVQQLYLPRQTDI